MQTTARSPIEKLLALHYQSLFRFARRLCASPARAMILTQRSLRLAVDRSRSLPVPANVRAWLLSILLREFLEARPRHLAGMTTCTILRHDSITAPPVKMQARPNRDSAEAVLHAASISLLNVPLAHGAEL